MARRFLRISPKLGIQISPDGRADFDSAAGHTSYAARQEVERWQERWSEVLAILEKKYDPVKVKEELDVAEEWLQAFEPPPKPGGAFVPPAVKSAETSRRQQARRKTIKAFMDHLGWSREQAEAVVDDLLSKASKE